MRRREFIAGLGAATTALTAWPMKGRAQQGGPRLRIGVLMPSTEGDEQGQLRFAVFQQGLIKLGWTNGQNVRIDDRWAGGDTVRERALATELVDLRPDVLLAANTSTLGALRQATRSIPIVFTTVNDPIGGGFVASLARPGGNITGFTASEPSLASKWVEVLKGIAPDLQRATFLFSPEFAPSAGEFFRHAVPAAARLRVELTAAAVRDETQIDDAFATLARLSNSGLVVNGDSFTLLHRERIISLAAQHRLPAIYSSRSSVIDGGLVSYGIDAIHPFRQAASYVDRILRGEKPADLPVQAPTKFELVINLKTAKALGLTIPEALLATADEVIQ
jgi:putative tryptophan/tyrosine transport system substrate-binding protein